MQHLQLKISRLLEQLDFEKKTKLIFKKKTLQNEYNLVLAANKRVGTEKDQLISMELQFNIGNDETYNMCNKNVTTNIAI